MPKKIVIDEKLFEDALKDYEENPEATLESSGKICDVSGAVFRLRLQAIGKTRGKRGPKTGNFYIQIPIEKLREAQEKTGSFRKTGALFGISHETARQRLRDEPYEGTHKNKENDDGIEA